MLDDALLQSANALGLHLQQRGLVLSCAESCTGGLLAGSVTAIAGSSAWFDRGFVTYSNEAKHDHLGVSLATLQQFGAVSPETAREMAQGVLVASPVSHVAVSTTGIAGPGGATPGKPVGLVCFGFARRTPQGMAVHVESRQFPGDRAQVRQAAVQFALDELLRLLA
ncbi:MAG: CinA family protein [Alcaligenaceae bacterium]|nr:CinA family protein [Alcaligenaceae bacterium]